MQSKLKNKNFTIISNNCWGGFVYKKFNLRYNSPFIGLFLFAPDYIYLLKNFELILNNELLFINAQDSRYKIQLIENETLGKYPIGKLDENVEIHFLHYKTEKEALDKWNERIKRINKDKILFKFSDRDLCNDDLIEEFLKLPYKNKICFCAKPYNNNSVITINEFMGQDCVESEWKFDGKYINIIEIINSL